MHQDATSSAGSSSGHGAPSAAAAAVPVKPYDVSHVALALSPRLLAGYQYAHAQSKAYAAEARPRLADNRNIAHFSLPYKEACHPIVAKSASGSHVTDADGNDLVDLGGGFGAVVFGHNPPFVRDAVVRMMRENAWGLGFEHPITGQNAEKVCQLTGMERCAFCTTGTEATSLAYRLCLRHTGRRRVVIFDGSYHGHFDGFLGAPTDPDAPDACAPVSPGIPAAYTRDLVVLRYGEPSALAYVEEHGEEIAAVFCEPIQNRNPSLVPTDFLHRLRALTSSAGVVLVFDEVVTGFRVAPGGAQEVLGVRCDLAAYGKALGGGYQVGCVAGRADIMAGVDGGDVDSDGGGAEGGGGVMGGHGNEGRPARPAVPCTHLAGTWGKHPLVMAATGAVLDHILSRGPECFAPLNALTDYLATSVNAWWREQGYALRVDHFCSMIRFVLPPPISLVFYQTLCQNGVYCWESRTCFLTTAHSRQDVDFVVEAVKATTLQLREHGIPLPEA